MNRKYLLIVILLNIAIASSFFIKNIGVGYTQLSSDLHNIIPMCMKFDNPDLYKNDLYLSDTNNFKYYTPFFVQTIRFFGNLANGNYVKGLNVLLFFTHLFFGLLWFYLFYYLFEKKFWIALFVSILIRGIIWLPGYEIWGISDLWSLMPRTLYAAILPLPFIVLFSSIKYKLLIASFLIGFIFNFHPISGLGGILIFVSLLSCFKLFYKNRIKTSSLLYGFLLLVLGMLPFLVTYFSKTETIVNYNLELYQTAFNSRIPAYFQEPLLFMKKWIAIKTLFFIVPLLGVSIYSFAFNKKYFKKSIILIIITVLLLIIPALSIPIENWFNSSFNTNLRMSFQLIRIQKFAILPAYFSIGYFLLLMCEKFKTLNKVIPGFVLVYIFILFFSNFSIFNKIPFISDDISRSIFPPLVEIVKPFDQRKSDFDKMALFINDNTPENAVFYNNFMLRSASKRSVKFDSKGASILIEGNPNGLIKWNQTINKLKGLNETEKYDFLKEQGIDYILTDKVIKYKSIIKIIGKYKLYSVR